MAAFWCAWCRQQITEKRFYYVGVQEITQRAGGFHADEYDYGWLCRACLERIEARLGALYDEMQKEQEEQERRQNDERQWPPAANVGN